MKDMNLNLLNNEKLRLFILKFKDLNVKIALNYHNECVLIVNES